MKITKKLLKSNKGGLFLISSAVIVSLVSFISCLYLIMLIRYDGLNLSKQVDRIQEDLLLRSESTRSNVSISHNENLPILPREVTIDNGDFLSTYTINTNMTDTSIENLALTYKILPNLQ